MSTVTGVVTNINKESKMSAAGKPYTLHSFEVNGQWYGCGFKQQAAVGDTVTFDTVLKYGKNEVNGNVIKGSTGGAKPFAAPPAPAKAASNKTFPIAKDSPDRSIIRQNAVTRAVEILVSQDAYKGKTDMQAAAQTIELARMFEDYYSGDLDTAVERAAESECTV